MCTVKSESESKFSKYQGHLEPVFQFEIKETQILKAKKWSPLPRGFDFYLVPHSEGHAWQPHNPQVYLNFPEIQWVFTQTGLTQVSLSLAFSAIFRMVLLSPCGQEKGNLRLRNTSVLECLSAHGGNDLPSWKLHKWDTSKITWCLSENGRLCVCSVSTVCPEDRWSLTVLFALPGQGGSFPSITLYKKQVKAPFLL